MALPGSRWCWRNCHASATLAAPVGEHLRQQLRVNHEPPPLSPLQLRPAPGSVLGDRRAASSERLQARHRLPHRQPVRKFRVPSLTPYPGDQCHRQPTQGGLFGIPPWNEEFPDSPRDPGGFAAGHGYGKGPAFCHPCCVTLGKSHHFSDHRLPLGRKWESLPCRAVGKLHENTWKCLVRCLVRGPRFLEWRCLG